MMLFNDLLHSSGYDIIQSIDGSDVLEIAKDRKPDLIIMDIQLPHRSGLEITMDLRADDDLKHIPIVAVTAFSMKGIDEKLREVGCDDFIAKPISVPHFLETVERLINCQNK